MNYWQLTVKRPNLGEEAFDLRAHSKVLVGDSFANDICLETTIIPPKLKIVRRTLGNRLHVRLTADVIPSLKGSFVKKSDWKTALYTGSIFEVTGDCEWNVDVANFKLSHKQLLPLTILPDEDRTIEKKHWKQSWQTSAGIHAALLLMFAVVGFLSGLFRSEINPADMQKVTVQQIQKVYDKKFANLKPEMFEVPGPQVTEIGKPEPKEEPPAIAPKPKVPTKVAKAKGKAPNKVASNLPAKSAPAPKNIESMGLLAIQSTAKPTKTNLDVAALAMGSAGSHSNKKDPRAGLGLTKGESDFGILAGAKGGDQVAQLDGSGVESYQGGLGEKVQKGSFRGASIRLVRREIEVRGGLDPAVIRQIIEERLSEVRYCYETALLKQTNLQGKISASWTILADGSVGSLTSESDEIKGNILHPCIKDQIKNWKFPSPKGGGVVHVKYPFLFSPVGS